MKKTDEDGNGEAARAWATAAREEIADFMAKIADTVREPFIVLDPDLRVVFANGAFYEAFNVDRAATEGRLVYELGNDQWDIRELRRLLEEVLPNDERFGGYRVEHVFEDIGRRAMVLNARRLDHVQLILLAIEDVTEREDTEQALRQSQDRQAFLLELSDALRASDDPDEIEAVASRLLAERLAAARVYYVACDPVLGLATVVRDHVAGDRPSFAGSYGYEALRTVLDRLGDGRTWVVENVAREALAPAEREGLLEQGVIAWIDAPLVRSGALQAVLCVVEDQERRWTDADVALVEDVAERTWDAVERARAERALRDSEARFRALVTAGAISLYRMSADWRFMYQLDSTNFLAAVADPIEGWRERYILADDRPRVDAAIEEALRTRSAFDLEHRVTLADGSVGWVLSRAVPILGPDGEIAEWFGAGTDVTARKNAEAALLESEERFRSFAENSADTLWIVDAGTGALQYLSPAFETMWGEPRERVMQDLGRWAELLHPDDRDRAITAMPRLMRGESIQQTYRIVRPDGAVRHIHDTGFPIRNGSGRILRVAGIAQDVTEQEEALLGLSASEQRLRLVVEAAHDYAIFVTDPEGMIVEWMPGAAAVFGWSAQEVVGQPAEVLFTPQDRASGEAAEELRSARENGAAANVRWHVAKGDRRVFIEGTVRPLRDAGGTLTGFLKIGQDVTERRRTERRVAESERRLRALVEGMPQLVWRAADSGEWTWASPQWSAYTGLSEAQSLGYGWLDAIHPDDRERTMAAWRQAERHGRLEVEYRVHHVAANRHRWFSTRARPVRDETGPVVEWLGTSTDIDDLRRLQDRQGVMVAELQHRTRNLITVVRSIAQQTMAAATSLDDFRPRFNDRLEALSRVQGLLSRAEEAPITIETLVRAELDALGADEMAGRIHVEGPPVQLRHSTVQTLALALHELATNARKHGALSSDGGRLRVTWQAVDDETGRSLAFVWRETGGAPPAEGDAARIGYGRELIERALPYSLNAQTSYVHDEAGVTCTISIPLRRT